MSRRHRSVQENLFGNSEMEMIKRQIQELDQQISKSLKNNDYQRAKTLTDQQAELLQNLVQKGEQDTRLKIKD